MLERFKHPSSQDAKDMLRLVPLSLLLLIASKVKPFSPNKGEAISQLATEQAKSLDDLYEKARLIAIPGIIGALAAFVALSHQETKNRVRFGERLTVSKIALHPKNFGVRLFPELANERFAGEIHFGGMWKLRFSPKETDLSVMRKLFSDLSGLASAVERNDPALADFDYFLGLSSMVTPLLEKYGFKVVHYKNRIGLPALGRANQSELSLKMRPVMAALINKQSLLENKDKLSRAARRQGSQ